MAQENVWRLVKYVSDIWNLRVSKLKLEIWLNFEIIFITEKNLLRSDCSCTLLKTRTNIFSEDMF